MTTLSISNISIRQDSEGRYCLNDLHKAAGGEERHSPNRFTRSDSYKALLDELTPEMAFAPVESTRGGKSSGTFACKELVYAYAMWISAKFHLQVIRAYDSLVTGERKQKPFVLEAAELYPALATAFRAVGIEGNPLILAVDSSAKLVTGVSLLESGQVKLIEKEQVAALTPTDIGMRIGLKAKDVNLMLTSEGLQTCHRDSKDRIYYEPTEKGKQFSEMVSTGKKHSDGTPVRQLKWKSSVISSIAHLEAV